MPDAARRVRRLPLAAAAAVTTAAGLAVATAGSGTLADAAGDVLYAVLVYLVLAFCVPGQRRAVLTVVAFGLCAVIELSQLTGVPAALAGAWEPLRFVLGTTFNAVDLVAYALGAVLGALVHRLLGRRAPVSPRAPSPPERPAHEPQPAPMTRADTGAAAGDPARAGGQRPATRL
ncbi:Protein of unknown function [Sanguibacter gelidistatuariae]|uniref:Uncharacterized protein n=1 Tax=Sanguibacter gelidistatuariae TaxID=1814289 RepID=A0A1G6K6I7_9MICO|nr:Protein of unknown function [Sanguibacter gelidistatuariae]